MLTVITATGDRDFCFRLSQKWMNQQTLQPDQWIVVNDGKEPINFVFDKNKPLFIVNIQRERQAGEPQFTMLLNLQAAIQYVIGDKIVIWEDDEYYAPKYLETMSKKLDEYDLVGIGGAKYYHISGKYYKQENNCHASLAQTAFNSHLLPQFDELLTGNMLLDERFWNLDIEKKHIFDDKKSLYCGMKGMPGRFGINAGHTKDFEFYQDDVNHKMLKQWIPKDYKTYLKLMGEI